MNRKFLLSVFTLYIAIGYISGCGAVEANNMNNKKMQNSPEETAQSCQNDLTFESLIREEESLNHSREPSFMIVSDWNQTEELNNLIPSFKNILLESMNYSEYIILAAFLGFKPSSGYTIKIEKICRNDHIIRVKASEIGIPISENEEDQIGTDTIVTYPYQIIHIAKEDHWNQDINFILSLDGQQVFTQTHYIPNPRRWQTLDKNDTHSDRAAGTLNLQVIATENEIPSVAELISSDALIALQELDYEESYGLITFQGQQPSDGYGIEIEEIDRTGNRVVIHTQATEPTGTTETHDDITSPYHLIRVDRFYENGDELDFVLAINGTEVLTRTAIIDQNPPIPTLTPAPTSTPIPTPVVPVITVGDYTVAPDGMVNVMVDVANFDSVGSINIELRYDPTVLQVMSCSKNLDDTFDFGICNSQYLSDTIRFNGIALTGISGNVDLVEISFEAIGQIGDKSAIELEVVTITDNNGLMLIADPINGQVVITEPFMGDVNCDGHSNPVDSLFILQYDVNLRNGSETCIPSTRSVRTLYTAACDINVDGECDAVDALIILQCDVGLQNEVCK